MLDATEVKQINLMFTDLIYMITTHTDDNQVIPSRIPKFHFLARCRVCAANRESCKWASCQVFCDMNRIQFDTVEQTCCKNTFVRQGNNKKVTKNNCIVLSDVAMAVNQHITLCTWKFKLIRQNRHL